MSINKLRLDFFYENKPFNLLDITLYVVSSPEINSSNLEQFFRKSREIQSIKERIQKLQTESNRYKDRGDQNRVLVFDSTIRDLYKTLNNLVLDIDEDTWDKISRTSSLGIFQDRQLTIFQDRQLTQAFLTFLTISNPVSKDAALANSKFIANLFTQSSQSRKIFRSGTSENADMYQVSLFKIIEDSFQRFGNEYSIKLEIEFKKIVDRQTVEFKIQLTGDITTKNRIDFKPQYSIKNLPSQYSRIYFDKRYRFQKSQVMAFSNIIERLKMSKPIEYEKFKDFKDIKEIFVIDKNFDKFHCY